MTASLKRIVAMVLKEFVQLNSDLSKTWPNIAEKKGALPTAEEFKDKEGKRAMLELAPGGK